MARTFLTSIDLTQNEILNSVIHNLGTAPSNPVEGQVYCNSSDHNIYVWLNGAWKTWIFSSLSGAASGVATLNSSSLVVQNPANAQTTPANDKIPLANASGKLANGWLNTGTGNGLDADTVDGQHGSHYLDRTNHTGTQAASTISDFDTQVRSNRLDQLANPTGSVNLNSQKLINVANPTLGTDAANKNYVDSASQGLTVKASVKAASTANVTLSGPQTVDTVSVVASDRVLIKNQDTASQNGLYTVQSGAWTRTSDSDTWDELVSAYVFVEQGSINANSGWVCDILSGGTLDSTSVTWIQFSQAGTTTASNVGLGSIGIFKQKTGSDFEFKTINDTSSIDVVQTGDVITFDVLPAGVNINNLGGGPLSVANGGTNATTAAGAKTNLGFVTKYAASVGNNSESVFEVTHNLGTTDVIVQVHQVASPYAVVEPDIEITSTNSVTLRFKQAPTTNQFRVVCQG